MARNCRGWVVICSRSPAAVSSTRPPKIIYQAHDRHTTGTTLCTNCNGNPGCCSTGLSQGDLRSSRPAQNPDLGQTCPVLRTSRKHHEPIGNGGPSGTTKLGKLPTIEQLACKICSCCEAISSISSFAFSTGCLLAKHVERWSEAQPKSFAALPRLKCLTAAGCVHGMNAAGVFEVGI
jgi:hypothetical protein